MRVGHRVAALLLLLEHGHEPLEQRAAHRVLVARELAVDAERRVRRARRHAELRLDRRGERGELLLVRRAALGPVRVEDRGEDALGDLERLVVQVLAAEELAAPAVDDLALLVHHVVVLEEVLADVEVVAFDLLLRVLDRALIMRCSIGSPSSMPSRAISP